MTMNNNQSIGAFSQRMSKKAYGSNSPLDTDPSSENANMCLVTVNYDHTMGQVTFESLIDGSVSVKKGDSVKLTATPNSGYRFIKWQGVKAVTKETSPTIDFVVNHDVNIEAVFAKEDKPAAGGAGNGGNGGNGSDGLQHESPVVSSIRKYWWVIAIILGYLILKEGEQ